MQIHVQGKRNLSTPSGKFTLEISDFKEFNIFPNSEAEKAKTGKRFKNFGPSVSFKLRDASGVANEYHNYMLPMTQEGRRFFLSGMRSSVAEPFRYLHIPADKDDSLNRFLKFHALLNDPLKIKRIAEKTVQSAMRVSALQDKKMQKDIVTSMMNLLALYNRGGYVAIDQDIRKKVPKDRQVKVAEAYVKILQNLLQSVYVEVLSAEGIDVKKGVSKEDSQFFEDAISAMAGIGAYASPVYFQLTDYKQRQSSGLQITRAPGKDIVLLGSLMLIGGIFMMFYISYQRLWIIVKPEDDQLLITFSGSGNRNQRDFAETFKTLADKAEKLTS